MSSTFATVQSDGTLNSNDKYFWAYQYRLGREVLIPYLKKNNISVDGLHVVEVGCAEGGVLAALVESGGLFGLGTDIAQSRLKAGQKINAKLGLNIELQKHDIFQDAIKDQWHGQFDLLILRDVIEHLDDPKLALQNVSQFLNEKGYMLVSFPPYSSPYGAHQHTLKNFWGYLPFLQLLPDFAFERAIKSGRKADVEEVRRLRQIQLTVDKFKDAVLNVGLRIEKEEYYLLRPVFKMKFGIPEISLTPIAAFPIIKNFFCLEATYLLSRNQKV